MPTELDPAWEYWTPDPEIAEAMGNETADGFDGLPVTRTDRRAGRVEVPGFRFGRGRTVDYFPFRFGRAKPDRASGLPSRWCVHCRGLFEPRKRAQRYCSRDCRYTAGAVAPVTCGTCFGVFKPSGRGRRFCSPRCCWAAKTGVPLRLDWDRIAALYQAGARVTDAAAAVGTDRRSVRTALVRRGVYRGAGKSGPVRTLPDRECRECGATFRPKCGTAFYCGRRCFADSCRLPPIPCGVCGATFRPKRWDTRMCSNACTLKKIQANRTTIDGAAAAKMRAAGRSAREIAAAIGASEVGVRAAIRRHLSQTESK
jgi:hypothetical protein